MPDYKISVGNVEIISISDGTLKPPVGNVFPRVTEEQWIAASRASVGSVEALIVDRIQMAALSRREKCTKKAAKELFNKEFESVMERSTSAYLAPAPNRVRAPGKEVTG